MLTMVMTVVIQGGILMKTISKSKLKANMLQIFREIEQTKEEMIVTDNGRPVLKIQPLKEKKSVKEVFGDIQGKVAYHEDILTPTSDEWEQI